jgi:ribose transport system permease protein
MLTQTSFGRHMMAVGANAETARLSGINPVRVRLAVFSGSGLLAGLAAVLTTARLGSADPNAGTGLELQAIAAAVIGGTSLMGGRGSAVGSFLGVLIMAVLGTGLVHKGAGDPSKRLITGAVIVAAVVLDHYRRKFSR